MKYTHDITINLPRKRVIELFDNPDNMEHWMEGLQSFEQLSGEPGQPGAKSKLKFKMGKREIEMIETVTKNELPDLMEGTYKAPGVYNFISNRFEEVDENTTKWIAYNEFQFKSFMMKVFGFLMPGAFKKQSKKYLSAFKEFAEGQTV